LNGIGDVIGIDFCDNGGGGRFGAGGALLLFSGIELIEEVDSEEE